MPHQEEVVVVIQPAASRGIGRQIDDDDTADDSVPPDPNNRGAVERGKQLHRKCK